MRRIPIRLRLTVGFAAVTAVVLVLVGAFAYQRLASGFSDDLNRELAQRAQDLSVAVSHPAASLDALAAMGLVERGESFAELESSGGTARQSTSTLHGEPLLTPSQAARAAETMLYVDLPQVPGLDEPARLLAIPIRVRGTSEILVVGATRENGLEALSRVRQEMLVGGGVLFLLVSGLAHVLSGAALRPVEAMRRGAAELTAGRAGQRLPLPAADDEVSRLGRTFNELLARLDDAMDRERAFVANASHQLRTPLALLQTELELAVRRPRSAAALRQAIVSAETEVQQLSGLAEDLLVLARASADGMPLVTEQVCTQDLLDSSAARFATAAAAADRHIHTDSGGVPWLRGDFTRLQHALHNLVDNALSHGAGDVCLLAVQTPTAVELHVKDRGAGIEADMRATAFDRFTRSAGSRGAGLGLAIVAAVAHAHGGSAGAANLPDAGADVWISVPGAPDDGSSALG